MSVLACGAAVIHGYFDVFDRAAAVLDDLIEQVKAEPIAVHPGDPALGIPAHFDAWPGERLAELEAAKEQLYQICDLAQRTLAELS